MWCKIILSGVFFCVFTKFLSFFSLLQAHWHIKKFEGKWPASCFPVQKNRERNYCRIFAKLKPKTQCLFSRMTKAKGEKGLREILIRPAIAYLRYRLSEKENKERTQQFVYEKNHINSVIGRHRHGNDINHRLQMERKWGIGPQDFRRATSKNTPLRCPESIEERWFFRCPRNGKDHAQDISLCPELQEGRHLAYGQHWTDGSPARHPARGSWNEGEVLYEEIAARPCSINER